MSAEPGIVLLDDKELLAICIVSMGQVVYQIPVPELNDQEAWQLVVNGLRQRLAMGGL